MVETSLETLWAEVVLRLQNELSTPSFETWVKTVVPLSLNDKILDLQVPTDFTRQIIASRYAGLIKDIATKTAGTPLEIRINVDEGTPRTKPTAEKTVLSEKLQEGPSAEYLSRLNPKYIFEAYVVGASNRFAHAACQAVAEMPARAYNPLFLYGGVGLGKTHLMHAIGHHVFKINPQARVLYVSSENFTNEMINAIRDDKMVRFRQRYRSIDVLLIDDIQFVAGKERTQEEFFHTFEALHGARKQIIISSDRPPKEIPTLEERLRSRFEWGLITDIQPPDLETRIAILAKKAQMEQLLVPDSVLDFIATRIDSNIRELEGALIRVMAYGSITRQTLNVDLAQEALKDVLPQSRPKPITIKAIQDVVGRHYDIGIEDFQTKKRTKSIAYPRQIAMYIAREITDASLPKIGEEFGGRDHTTVMHACDKISKEVAVSQPFSQLIKDLIKQIKTR